ncbi:MAG: flagellar assembly protein FliW [Gemmatimonadales bacterium]|nr:flagellar assembly protein FliW [Gemmatimonadales bacterium]
MTATARISATIRVATLRFGAIEIPSTAVYTFPRGLPGFDGLDRFALLPVREGLGWLQSLEVASLAFLVAEPHRIVPGAWEGTRGAWAIITLGETPEHCTANLRAPLILNPVNRLGLQWIAADSSLSTVEPVNLLAL